MEKNNFNFLRLLFALFVVITHAHTLSATPTGDYLSRLTNGQITLSFIGLSGFFTISGYCVYKSLDRSTGIAVYYWKRILRIFPGLFIVLLLTVLLGPLVYDSGIYSYLANRSVWTYLPSNMTLFHQQGMIDGIFTNNPYDPTINGSLWSLLYEFAFYIFLSGLFFIPKHKGRTFTVFLVLGVLVTGSLWFRAQLGSLAFILEAGLVLEFAPFFFSGALMAMLPAASIRQQNNALVGLMLLLILATYAGAFTYARYFTLPPMVVWIGLRSTGLLVSFIEKLGDISYGIYIYSFPVQQTLMHYFHWNTFELMAVSLVISCLAGYLSWHWVEKRFLRYKEFWNATENKPVG
jgi:peptidoglycan/LPS O-acetylase OafA/YrhL